MTIQLRAPMPCHQQIVHLDCIPSVPRQRYSRICKTCKTTWEITRKTGSATDAMRVDILEWQS